jgi:hypothetical protein
MRSSLDPHFAQQLAGLYARMEEAYDQTARVLAFSCTGCPDNCCDSYFTHHTYIEWAYLWQGLVAMPAARLTACRQRAAEYEEESRCLLAEGKRPQVMCPLNEQGLCSLYSNRLMICRLHGVPSSLTRPDGCRLQFPGCFRCQEVVAGKANAPVMDRTTLLQHLVKLEVAWLGSRRPLLPKVKMTIARMILEGPPQL